MCHTLVTFVINLLSGVDCVPGLQCLVNINMGLCYTGVSWKRFEGVRHLHKLNLFWQHWQIRWQGHGSTYPSTMKTTPCISYGPEPQPCRWNIIIVIAIIIIIINNIIIITIIIINNTIYYYIVAHAISFHTTPDHNTDILTPGLYSAIHNDIIFSISTEVIFHSAYM